MDNLLAEKCRPRAWYFFSKKRLIKEVTKETSISIGTPPSLLKDPTTLLLRRKFILLPMGCYQRAFSLPFLPTYFKRDSRQGKSFGRYTGRRKGSFEHWSICLIFWSFTGKTFPKLA
ncbi:hypothetical protein Fot_09861 [Forsythia ovata]|uniref:Uncharacterized protein n=1 Tax=Forsythia ovata TaxID=205694 RepID=A0ABD1WFL0_9LAMI